MAEKAIKEMSRASEECTALLPSQEQLLKIFVRHVPAAVAMLDHDMRYLQVSDRWCSDFSLDSSKVIGRSHYEIFPDMPDRWKEINPPWRRKCIFSVLAAGNVLRKDNYPPR